MAETEDHRSEPARPPAGFGGGEWPAETLVATVRGVLPSLTPAARTVARLILDDPAMVARSTITELSSASGTSEATIVRTARALGFAGYPQLRLALAAASAGRTPDRLVPGDVGPDDPLADVILKVSRAESEAIKDTVAQLTAERLGPVVDSIAAARRVDVYGVGASGLVAADMSQKLLRIGVAGNAFTDAHLALTSAVLLRPGDVAVGVSTSGETPDVLEPLRTARDAGATTVAITNNPRSSMAALAEHLLISAGRETAFRPGALASRISQLLVVDCVFVGVAQRTFDRSQQALQATRKAIDAFVTETRPPSRR
ncbi:DNA-binding MurR/RpiR family transcriptional regulator [Thermocatellispora tengchongensis]|uniref:DNA-binding MurR/RpiR family transcriptional regulator n=1 Tax=Thermocatellispora tengchongensis TaxID=1073253 RepID=A0A840NZP6_9ACTN|nr:MurR/RpiR family transcriptional regulator [Thermocatellispora tengchongensis]MBB5132622.1 DNA-binding MurR/RpiR family transcriptional regulator [Thermocatellispora tengchongensis]